MIAHFFGGVNTSFYFFCQKSREILHFFGRFAQLSFTYYKIPTTILHSCPCDKSRHLLHEDTKPRHAAPPRRPDGRSAPARAPTARARPLSCRRSSRFPRGKSRRTLSSFSRAAPAAFPPFLQGAPPACGKTKPPRGARFVRRGAEVRRSRYFPSRSARSTISLMRSRSSVL